MDQQTLIVNLQIFLTIIPQNHNTRKSLFSQVLQIFIYFQLFKKVHEQDPEARNKVIPIQGDITHKSLGISDSDWELLVNNVNIIMHSAATVKFNEHIRFAS